MQAGLARARLNEKAISDGITRSADALPTGWLAGFPHRLKDLDPLARKVASDLDDPGNLAQTLARIKDNVRCTMNIPTGNYVQETTEAVRGLRSAGFEPVQWKSAWNDLGPVTSEPTAGGGIRTAGRSSRSSSTPRRASTPRW